MDNPITSAGGDVGAEWIRLQQELMARLEAERKAAEAARLAAEAAKASQGLFDAAALAPVALVAPSMDDALGNVPGGTNVATSVAEWVLEAAGQDSPFNAVDNCVDAAVAAALQLGADVVLIDDHAYVAVGATLYDPSAGFAAVSSPPAGEVSVVTHAELSAMVTAGKAALASGADAQGVLSALSAVAPPEALDVFANQTVAPIPTPALTSTSAASPTAAPNATPTADPLPAIDWSRVTLSGVSQAEVTQLLTWMWNTPDPTGQLRRAVSDFIAQMNRGVTIQAGGIGNPMQANPATATSGATLVINSGMLASGVLTAPPTVGDAARVAMSFFHEMQHLVYDASYSGSSYGEMRAYLQGYAFMRNVFGLDDAGVRSVLGPQDPTWIFGHMVYVDGVNPNTTTFVFGLVDGLLPIPDRWGPIHIVGNFSLNPLNLREVVSGSNLGSDSTFTAEQLVARALYLANGGRADLAAWVAAGCPSTP